MRVTKLFAFVFLLFLAGCAGSSENLATSKTESSMGQPATEKGGGGGGKEVASQMQVSTDQIQKSQPQSSDRKIIRNGELNLEANSPEESQQKIATIVDSKSGFVIESQQSTSDVKTTTRDVVTMTIRVPADKFNETLGEIRKSADRVILETVKGEDVTEEFVDVESSLRTKKALEAQFLEIMKQARTVEDALSVQTQLSNVRGEIEKIEGRKRYLENQSSLSTIKIRLQTPAVFSASSNGFFYELSKALSDGFQSALAFILVLIKIVITVLPFLLLVVLPIFLVVNFIIKRNKRTKVADDTKLD